MDRERLDQLAKIVSIFVAGVAIGLWLGIMILGVH